MTPNSGQPVRDASILFAVSANPVSGAIYVAWQDFRFLSPPPTFPTTCTTPTGTILVDSIAFSVDGRRRHWSAPIMINQDAAELQRLSPAGLHPGGCDGKAIVVTYYDFRNDTNTPTGFEGTDYFAVICTVATTAPSAEVWGDEQRLTTASFNILNAPNAPGHFLGDYMGLAASGSNTVVPLFGAAAAPNTTAEFTRKISGLP